MKIILHMAMSVNGIIATPDGKEDFLSSDNWNAFVEHAKEVGNIIWGHNTYEQVINWPARYLDKLDNVTKIVISRDRSTVLDSRFIHATSPEDAVAILENKGFKEAIVTGGSTNNSEFAKRNLLNEIFITVDSVIAGAGIPIFKSDEFTLNLELLEMKKVTNRIISLKYKVV